MNYTKRIFRFLNSLISVFFLGLIRGYQLILSPWLGANCRFTPTCSQYSLEAIRKYGCFKGLWLTFGRILRCHPWGGHGHDPVP